MPSRNPRRKPDKRNQRFLGELRPDPRFRTVRGHSSPAHFEQIALMLDPIGFLIPQSKQKPTSISELVQSLKEKEYVHVIRTLPKKGDVKDARYKVLLTPRGRAQYTINRFLLNKRSLLQRPREEMERLAQYLVVDLILKQDFRPSTGKYSHHTPLAKVDIFRALQAWADMPSINRSFSHVFGPSSEWTDLESRYHHYLSQRAVLARDAMELLKNRPTWGNWMQLRSKGKLEDLLP